MNRGVDMSEVDARVSGMTVEERFARSVELSKLLPSKAEQDRAADRVVASFIVALATIFIVAAIWI